MSSLPVADNFSNKGLFQAIIPGTNITRTFTNTSAQTAALQPTTNVVKVYATQDCWLAFGANPTATTGDMFLPKTVQMFIGVTPGTKIAALRDSADGSLYITEGA